MRKMVIVLAAIAIVVLAATPARAIEKRFSFDCDFTRARQVDPIVTPGPLGTRSAHMHVFFGNTSTDSNSNYASMTAAGTSCEIQQDTAGYWIPPLKSPSGTLVNPVRTNVYYRSVGALENAQVQAFPANLRIVSNRYLYHCGGNDQASSMPGNCGGKDAHLTIYFPACWNGTQIDSLDHISHMAFQTGRGCPASHPVAVPRLALIARFPISNATGYSLSSGAAATAHGDFWNTWQQRALEQLVARCLGASATTSCGDIAH